MNKKQHKILNDLIKSEMEKDEFPYSIEYFKPFKEHEPLKEIETEKGKKIAESIRSLK